MENDNDIPLDNLADFTAYKLRGIVEQLADQGYTDLAHGVHLALDQYLLGNIDIGFKDGMPYVSEVYVEDT